MGPHPKTYMGSLHMLTLSVRCQQNVLHKMVSSPLGREVAVGYTKILTVKYQGHFKWLGLGLRAKFDGFTWALF